MAILGAAGFDAFVEGLCARFYTTMGRPSLAPGRYFRLLFLGYFEGLDSERAIAWRAADSLSLRAFLHLGSARVASGPFDDLADAAAVSRRDASGGLSRGRCSSWWMPVWFRGRRWHRCDDAGSECGDAEHRAS